MSTHRFVPVATFPMTEQKSLTFAFVPCPPKPFLHRVNGKQFLSPQRPLPILSQKILTNSSSSSHAHVPKCSLFPSNTEVDWVIVDVSLSGLSAAPTPTFLAEAEDDAKSLVRTVLRDKSAELSVVFSSNVVMREMNSKWRGVDDTTDVLSFPQNDPDKVVLGDVSISVETAMRQAEQEGIGLRDEVRILMVHGVLHLLGYDHEGAVEGDWLVMAQMENRLLKQLGWDGEGLVAAVQDPYYKGMIQA